MEQYTDDQLKYALAQKEILVQWLLVQRDNERAQMDLIANELKRRSDNASNAPKEKSDTTILQEPKTE